MGLKDDWQEFNTPTKVLIGGLAVGAAGFLLYGALKPASAPAQATTVAPGTQAQVGKGGDLLGDPLNVRVLPETPRNQGLEDMKQEIDGLKAELSDLKRGLGEDGRGRLGIGGFAQPDGAQPGTSSPAAKPLPAGGNGQAGNPAGGAGGLDTALPPPGGIDASALSGGAGPSGGASALRGSADAGAAAAAAASEEANAPTVPAPRPEMKVWAQDTTALQAQPAAASATLVVPVNSALEGVTLTGFNARPSGSVTAAVGTVNSANSVGAPFVTRIKGNAILPNGWRIADLGDCFLGGSATAVLSAERAYTIADKMSCVAPDGTVWEGDVRAYGVDVDGTLGLAGKVVSKQGSLLAQAALTGMVSGLGSALSPAQIPAYQSNAANGSQAGYQLPDVRMVGATAVGEGISHAAAQVSKFYLDYAKEVFPVVEVTSGTRITWVLTSSLELHRRRLAASASSQTP